MATKIYQEKHRFNDKLLIILLGAGVVALLYAASTIFFDERTTLTYALISLLLAGGLSYAVYYLTRLRYKLQVTDKQIKFKLAPFQRAAHKIKWGEIDACEIVKTPKVARWHGSNLRRPRERYFSLAGRNGLAITTKAGHRYFLGCRHPEKLVASLNGASLREVVDVAGE